MRERSTRAKVAYAFNCPHCLLEIDPDNDPGRRSLTRQTVHWLKQWETDEGRSHVKLALGHDQVRYENLAKLRYGHLHRLYGDQTDDEGNRLQRMWIGVRLKARWRSQCLIDQAGTRLQVD